MLGYIGILTLAIYRYNCDICKEEEERRHYSSRDNC